MQRKSGKLKKRWISKQEPVKEEEKNIFLSKKRDHPEMVELNVSDSESKHSEENKNPEINLTQAEKLRKLKKKERTKKKRKEKWYKSRMNTYIYVKGLPLNTNEQEFLEYFSKCGLIRRDLKTGNYKIKLYKDTNGTLKGDGVVSYNREESMMQAIELLNGSEYAPGHVISVEQAKFEQKTEVYIPRENLNISEQERFRLKTELERELGWMEDDQTQGLKIVVLKHMFKPIEFHQDEGLYDDLVADIEEDLQSSCGKISKYEIFKEHPEGVVKIKFETPVGAHKCISLFDGKYYNEKLVRVVYWDGKTDFKKNLEETLNEEKRLEEFGKWLEEEK